MQKWDQPMLNFSFIFFTTRRMRMVCELIYKHSNMIFQYDNYYYYYCWVTPRISFSGILIETQRFCRFLCFKIIVKKIFENLTVKKYLKIISSKITVTKYLKIMSSN